MQLLDTIAAISTPHGKGGVAVIRISGADAVAVAARVFSPKSGKPLQECRARSALYGTIYAGRVAVDDGIATVFFAPASFTGEDTVEICCHGGILLTQTVLQAVLCAGARAAQPGEFTRRAFLNGKMDLGAAEALGDLLEAQSDHQLRLAYGGMSGRLGVRTQACYEQLRRVMSSVLACIDFPDEDLAEMSRDQMQSLLCQTAQSLRDLSGTYRTGHAVAEGVRTVICGRTNVGKSSLYNAILGEDAAIVTDIEGTTRDVLCQTTSLRGVTLRLFDTAGLRSTRDEVERIGIDRAKAALKEAELLLGVLDATREMTEEEAELLAELACRQEKGAAVLVLLNKIDRADEAIVRKISASLEQYGLRAVRISALTKEGLDDLATVIEELFLDGSIDLSNDAVVANARQQAAIMGALEALERTLQSLSAGMPLDICCVDLGRAMSALSELDGRQVSEDVVSEIFAHFCVGK